MATPRELFLEYLKPDGHPQRQLAQYEALAVILCDPINGYLRGNREKGSLSVDRWGTTIAYPADAPGAMPYITEENKVCPDVTRWRDYVRAPDLAAHCSTGWEPARQAADAVRGEKLATALMGTGIFEQCHFLMGFEDTLTGLYEHPDEMHELIDYITDYRIEYARLLIDGMQPDAILSHDDWGAKDALFMNPDVWREFFKEPYRRFYGYIRSRGVIAIHHADSYLVPIIEDMVELGIQTWQGVLPENDIPALKAQLRGRMLLMGGIGAAIDRSDAAEPEIRAYVRGVLEQNCPGGHYIPCITYGLQGTVYPHVDRFIDDEIAAYNSVLHLPDAKAPAVRRAAPGSSVSAPAAKTDDADDGSVLSLIGGALRKGQKKKLLRLCADALEQGVPAQTILSDGLIRGMTLLGEDFSANRAFVPEMLIAAKCMNAATELLRPHLGANAASAAGKVCLGTVRGDMHDIGKNLVKLMMEGCGLTVVDLGVDVAPEVFIQTAREQHCGVIACSSLLTTTMPEMRRVVELAETEGIRDQVRIIVGGAPITQSFCDEIGADAYTADAAQAAQAALALLAR